MFNAAARARLKSLCEASKISLVTSVGVSGGHRALDDAELVVQNLGERRQAVSGARRVGDDVGGRVVLVRVDANDVGRDVVTLGRGGDDNLLGTRGDVLASARAVNEDTSTFDDDVDAHFLPRQLATGLCRRQLG